MIFVTGDTHGTQDAYKLHIFAGEHPELSLNDYVIIAGDFGAIWNERTVAEELYFFTHLPFTVLFVDGNHENFDLINSYPVSTWKGGKVHQIRPNVIHLMRGQVYEIEGKTIFTFGGATSIDKYYRIKGRSWWPQELPSRGEMEEGLANLKRYQNKVDYIITHSCPLSAFKYPALLAAAGIKVECPESELLSNFDEIVAFKHWYFGHFHIDAQLSNRYTVLYQDVVRIEDDE